MAVNLRPRLLALEKALAPLRCRACGGVGIGAIVTVRDPADRGRPRGCARCGKVSAVKRIVLLPLPEVAA